MANDQKTLALIKEVNKRKAEISKLERPNWKTNCSFSYTEGRVNDTINIHVQSDLRVLVNIVAFLMERERYFKDAVVELGVSLQDFFWNGFTATDWIEDIKTRINKIQISSKKKNLEELETRLNAIVSPELRAELELQAIEEALS